jgi:hypothetical protein
MHHAEHIKFIEGYKDQVSQLTKGLKNDIDMMTIQMDQRLAALQGSMKDFKDTLRFVNMNTAIREGDIQNSMALMAERLRSKKF